MNRRRALVHYQTQAANFKVGDWVYPTLGANPSNGGRVVAVWPAIGMVDVQYPHGASRCPVEDLLIDREGGPGGPLGVSDSTVPGGAGTVPVSGGPARTYLASSSRVASSFLVRQAIYWAGPDRKFRPSRTELDRGEYRCPRCEKGTILRRVVYKREGGRSEKLLCCPRCLFLTRQEDLVIPAIEGASEEPLPEELGEEFSEETPFPQDGTPEEV